MLKLNTSNDKKYMHRCLQLAKMGLGNTYPNPLVGSVIVHDNIIIGEGYHTKAGEPHAEVNAINSVKNKKLLENSTLYVNLEPCSHFGKTPPCDNLIVKHKIKKVVIGTIDTTAKVSGKGVKILKKGGCKVEIGVLQKESREINKRFFTFHEKKRPYIILKWAQTIDGYIDKVRKKDAPIQPNWIIDPITRIYSHKWRAEEESIIVGTKTVENDNPKLDVRDWKGTNPLRLFIDKKNRTSNNILNSGKAPKTVCFNENENKFVNKNLSFVKINFENQTLEHILYYLYNFKIQSLIVEGGAKLLNSFIKENLWDEARIFIGNNFYNAGVKAPKINFSNTKIDSYKANKIILNQNFLNQD